MAFWKTVEKGLAAINGARLHGGLSAGGNWHLGGTDYNFRRAVGKGYDNSAVYTCTQFLGRKLAQSSLRLAKGEYDDLEWVEKPERDLAALLEVLAQPNKFYSGTQLWMATITQLAVSEKGAFWYRLKDRVNRTVGFYFISSDRVTLRADGVNQDGLQVITHCDIQQDAGGTIAVPYEDIVHLRWSLDLDNQMLSYAPLAPILREVFADNEAPSYTAALMRNMGVPGFVVSPDMAKATMPSQALMDNISEDLKNLTRDNRGSGLAFRFPVNIQQLTIEPEKMVLDKIRAISADRICAAFGFDPMAVGLPSSSKTYSNLEEAKLAAILDVVEPLLGDLAQQLTNQLLGTDRGLRLAFDTSRIPSLVRYRQEHEDKRREMDRKDFIADKITRGEFRERSGLPSGAGDNLYYSQIKSLSTPAPIGLSARLTAQRQELAAATADVH